MVGDAAAIGSRTLLISELLCESVDLRAGERVLDVPCASGSAALAAARRFCRAVGVDAPDADRRGERAGGPAAYDCSDASQSGRPTSRGSWWSTRCLVTRCAMEGRG